MLQLNDVFKIKKNTIHTKVPCSITINSKEYDERSFIETSTEIKLPGILSFFIPEKDDHVQLTIPYIVNLQKTTNTIVKNNTTIINYNDNDLLVSKDYVLDIVDIGLLIKLLQGRIKWVKDPKILLNMIHSILPSVDLVHFELIISNMFRDSKNLDKKCRMSGNYKNFEILGQAKQPQNDSWASAMSFQYINKAIKSGLISEKEAEMNPIELVLNENYKQI